MRQTHNFTRESLDNVTSHTKRLQYEKYSAYYKRKTPVSSVSWYKPVLPISEIPIQEINSRIGNLCTFTCPYCDYQDIPNWCVLIHHCKTVHKCSIQYNMSLVVVAKSHACLLCPNAVLNDRYFLANHLWNSHKRSVARYEGILNKYGGETLPTFRKWLKLNQT